LKKNKNSSHKLPKQQSTSYWSQGILGVKKETSRTHSGNDGIMFTYVAFLFLVRIMNMSLYSLLLNKNYQKLPRSKMQEGINKQEIIKEPIWEFHVVVEITFLE
jgi:hypothetical protein